MIKEEIKVYEDPKALSKGFTEFVLKLLDVYPHINLALSGGTTPKVIFDYWADTVKSLSTGTVSHFSGGMNVAYHRRM